LDEAKIIRTAQFKLKIDQLAFFTPSLARKTQSVTRKRVNVTRRSRSHLAGVDGCNGGWIVVHSTRNASCAEIQFVERWQEIHPRFDVVAVDMPIGMTECGRRACELEAREILRPHGARVFNLPPRGALDFASHDWAGANAWSKSRGLGGISKQSWNILPKIAEIDGVIAASDQRRIFEAHPELAFCRLNGGKPLPSKHTAAGLTQRRRLLKKAGFDRLGEWLARRRQLRAKTDDIFDACALLLTAERIRKGTAVTLPMPVPFDNRGLQMAIRY
jgi:predicted RNase H-like nuclease